jgi:tetratricopeptide (TPR) repeat protein
MLWLLLAATAWCAEDIIVVKGKQPREVLIVKEDSKSVTIKDLQTGATQKFKDEDVLKLVYKDAHPTFVRALEAIEGDNWQFAFQNISAALKAQKKSKGNWHDLYFSYYTAKILNELSKLQANLAKNAEAFLLKFIKKGKDSRFYDDAHFELAELYMRTKRFDDARKTLTSIEKVSSSQLVKGKAKSETAKSYLYSGDSAKSLEMGMALIKSGVINEGIMEVFAIALVDKSREYDKAYKIASALVGKGNSVDAMRKVHELKGCAAFHLKKYGEGLEDLLRAQLLYGDEETASSRLNVYLASTIHVLMKLKPSEYGSWEYRPPYTSLRKGLSIADGKRFQKLTQKL